LISFFSVVAVSIYTAKYQSADNGAVTSVSSINWSKTSMTKNREAGVVFDGTASDEAAAITAQMQVQSRKI
jgi:phosphatidylserine/phosphatidylglycerophosphate/cardiolipin synthase-like enzyme